VGEPSSYLSAAHLSPLHAPHFEEKVLRLERIEVLTKALAVGIWVGGDSAPIVKG